MSHSAEIEGVAKISEEDMHTAWQLTCKQVSSDLLYF